MSTPCLHSVALQRAGAETQAVRYIQIAHAIPEANKTVKVALYMVAVCNAWWGVDEARVA